MSARRLLGLALWRLGFGPDRQSNPVQTASITYSEHTERLAAFALSGELDERQEGFR